MAYSCFAGAGSERVMIFYVFLAVSLTYTMRKLSPTNKQHFLLDTGIRDPDIMNFANYTNCVDKQEISFILSTNKLGFRLEFFIFINVGFTLIVIVFYKKEKKKY